VAEQVFDFYCYVVGELWMLGVQRLDDARGVGDTVEEIWITEGDVLRAGDNLLVDIGEDDFLRNDAKLAFVYRDDRAMAAPMFAAAGGFRIAGRFVRAVG